MFNRSPRHLKNVEDKKMFSKSTEFNELKGWTPPIFHTGSECYISFTAFCPTTGKMRRKRIKLDHIKSKRLQKAKAQWMIPSGAVDERVRKRRIAHPHLLQHTCDPPLRAKKTWKANRRIFSICKSPKCGMLHIYIVAMV